MSRSARDDGKNFKFIRMFIYIYFSFALCAYTYTLDWSEISASSFTKKFFVLLFDINCSTNSLSISLSLSFFYKFRKGARAGIENIYIFFSIKFHVKK